MEFSRGQSHGITLIELILYIAILTFMLIILTNFFGGVLRTKGVTDAKVEVVGNLRFIAERITQEVRLAQDIVSPTSGTPGDILCLRKTATTGVKFQRNTGTNAFEIVTGGDATCTGGTAESLTSANVLMDTTGGSIFTLVQNAAPAKKTVQINLKIKYNNLGRPALQYTETIKTSASLR